MDETITVPCQIVFDRSDRQRSTINIRYKVIEEGEEDIDIPLFFNFEALYNFGILPNGRQQLKSANLHCIDERSICSLLDIRDYSHIGRFNPPSNRGEGVQSEFDDIPARTERIIHEIESCVREDKLKLTTPFTNFINIIKHAKARLDMAQLRTLYLDDFNDYYRNEGYDNPENKISQFVKKREDIMTRGGGKKKNCRRSCRTRYKSKRAKHSKSKKRYRKSKKRMLRS
jgi:hypothetical protein